MCIYMYKCIHIFTGLVCMHMPADLNHCVLIHLSASDCIFMLILHEVWPIVLKRLRWCVHVCVLRRKSKLNLDNHHALFISFNVGSFIWHTFFFSLKRKCYFLLVGSSRSLLYWVAYYVWNTKYVLIIISVWLFIILIFSNEQWLINQ